MAASLKVSNTADISAGITVLPRQSISTQRVNDRALRLRRLYFAESVIPLEVMRRRDLCPGCNRSRASCFCKFTKPFHTKTRFIILMHPREFKRQRTGTGRVTRMSLLNSEIMVGVDFTDHEALSRVLADATLFPMLLFPGETALNLTHAPLYAEAQTRQPVVIVIDATWASARKMLRSSPNLWHLPRLTFEHAALSKFVIKRQPQEFCLSTIEAVYRLLGILDEQGYESLGGQHQNLLVTLDAIVAFQRQCEADPNLPSHRLGKKVKPAATLA